MPLVGVDAQGAFLMRLRLDHAPLARTNFASADLRGCYFRSADLDFATLAGANFRGCDLENVNLENSDLFDADLTGVKLAHARLDGTNLSNADLHESNLEGVLERYRGHKKREYFSRKERARGVPAVGHWPWRRDGLLQAPLTAKAVVFPLFSPPNHVASCPARR